MLTVRLELVLKVADQRRRLIAVKVIDHRQGVDDVDQLRLFQVHIDAGGFPVVTAHGVSHLRQPVRTNPARFSSRIAHGHVTHPQTRHTIRTGSGTVCCGGRLHPDEQVSSCITSHFLQFLEADSALPAYRAER